jgi:hypothetical protein
MAACQLFELASPKDLDDATSRALYSARTATIAQRIRIRSALVNQWRADYPFVTR